jgi:serine/threonine-protein kinase
VVLRCLAKKPDERYPDVKHLGRALSACNSAGAWDAEQADRWWVARAPSVSIDAPPQPAGFAS